MINQWQSIYIFRSLMWINYLLRFDPVSFWPKTHIGRVWNLVFLLRLLLCFILLLRFIAVFINNTIIIIVIIITCFEWKSQLSGNSNNFENPMSLGHLLSRNWKKTVNLKLEQLPAYKHLDNKNMTGL